jgi:soluble lytic murein transglycosylase-like protein
MKSSGKPESRTNEVAILVALTVVSVVSGVVALYALHELGAARATLESRLVDSNERLLELHAQLAFASTRRQHVLGLRDEIQRARPGLDVEKVHNYAEWVVRVAEKYPGIDPAVLVAIGIVESRYDADAESDAGARGLYQILPSTGRLLARSLGWEYSDEMLFDPRTNTELAAYYLELLSATHDDDVRLMLAEYNGGPANAAHYQSGSSELADETRQYVPKVLEAYERIHGSVTVDTASVSVSEPMPARAKHRDPETTGPLGAGGN